MIDFKVFYVFYRKIRVVHNSCKNLDTCSNFEILVTMRFLYTTRRAFQYFFLRRMHFCLYLISQNTIVKVCLRYCKAIVPQQIYQSGGGVSIFIDKITDMDCEDLIVKFVSKSSFCNYLIFSEKDATCAFLKSQIVKILKDK